jgi:hypothetical protein
LPIGAESAPASLISTGHSNNIISCVFYTVPVLLPVGHSYHVPELTYKLGSSDCK